MREINEIYFQLDAKHHARVTCFYDFLSLLLPILPYLEGTDNRGTQDLPSSSSSPSSDFDPLEKP